MTRLVLLILLIALGVMNLALLENKETNNGLPLVHADFPSCITDSSSPLLRTPNGRLDYRQGDPANDKGVS